MKVGFDGGIKLEFHGAKVTSAGGLLAYREHDSISTVFRDSRTVRNVPKKTPVPLAFRLQPLILEADVLLENASRA